MLKHQLSLRTTHTHTPSLEGYPQPVDHVCIRLALGEN